MFTEIVAEQLDRLGDMVFHGFFGELHTAGDLFYGFVLEAAELEDVLRFLGQFLQVVVDDGL